MNGDDDTMPCEGWEMTSAALDGELAPEATDIALEHARACPHCARLIDADAVATPLVVLPATVIDTDRLTGRERRWLTGGWTRTLLLIAALVIVAEAIPAYIRGDGLSAESHAARHLASWQIGFGVGLVVAASIARLSQAILALAVTFAALTIGATAIDVLGGHRGPLTESVHLVELVAVFLLWRMAPSHLLPWRRPPSDPRPDASRSTALHRPARRR